MQGKTFNKTATMIAKTNIEWYKQIVGKTVKSAFSGLKLFVAIESPLKMMKNAFYFTSKALLLLKIFKFLSWFFGHVAKQLD